MKSSDTALPVSMLRQWCFCPRIVWFNRVLHLDVAYPPWVDQGVAFHNLQDVLCRRRTMSYHGLQNAIRHEAPMLTSDSLDMYGRPDLLLETESEICPVEYKIRMSHPGRGHVLQLAVYGLLAEESHGKKCSMGFFISGKRVKIRSISIDQNIKDKAKQAIRTIHAICNESLIPDSPANTSKCCQCEYLNHCNDRF